MTTYYVYVFEQTYPKEQAFALDLNTSDADKAKDRVQFLRSMGHVVVCVGITITATQIWQADGNW